MNWTAADLKNHLSKQLNKPVAKYKSVKVEVDGEKFDSKKELARYGELILLQKKGEILELHRQIPFPIFVNGQLICKYIADFVYIQNGQNVVEDVKSKHTRTLPVYRLKKKLLKAVLGIDIKES